MKLWITEIEAIDPRDGKTKKWAGISVPGLDREDAERYIQEHGMGYLRIIGELEGVVVYIESLNVYNRN